jgi:hypothetical protein
MPIYTLYLRTDATTTNNPIYRISRTTNGQRVTWSVNFDELFNDDNYKFKHCRITSQMGYCYILNSYAYDNFVNYLSINLASDFNGSTTTGQILDIINMGNSPVGTNVNVFNNNTFSTKGINFTIPYGTFFLTLELIQSTNASLNSASIFPIDYSILLKFELY